LIPTEACFRSEARQKKIESGAQAHPGYVYINMYLRDEEKKLVERTWYFVRETNGVIGFADGDNPQPIRPSEWRPCSGQMREREEKVPAQGCLLPRRQGQGSATRSVPNQEGPHRGRRHGTGQAQGSPSTMSALHLARTRILAGG